MPHEENLSAPPTLPKIDIFTNKGMEGIPVQHSDLESLSVSKEESAKLYTKTKETAERLGVNDLLSQAGSKIDAVVKMTSYEEAMKGQTELVRMDDEQRDKIYATYRKNVEDITPEIPTISRHFVLMETLQTMFKESLESGKLVYFDDGAEQGGKTKLQSHEIVGIPPLLEIMKVDYLVHCVKPGALDEDYARPLERIRVLMDDILTSNGEGKAEKDRADVQEIFEEMVESLKFIGTQDPEIALSDIRSGLSSSSTLLPGNAIKYNPLAGVEHGFSIDKSVLARKREVAPDPEVALLEHLSTVTPQEVYAEKTTYWPRQMFTQEKSNYDIRELASPDFEYYARALVSINGVELVGDKARLASDINFLATKNEQEGGMLSRVSFILDSLKPLEGASKGDLVKLAAAYVARTELNRLAEGSTIEKRRVPMLKAADTVNPERQQFFNSLDNLDSVFVRLFDRQMEPQEVENARGAIFNAVDSMRTAELRWTRAQLTTDNLPTEFPGVLDFVEAGTDKMPWGRNITGKNGEALLKGEDVSDGFPINV